MAKVTAPLLSFGAKGQIGKTMVMGDWRGVKYARQYVEPANPRTTAQQNNRTTFAFLREAYKLAPALVRAPWDAFASGRPFTGVNKFVGENLRLIGGSGSLATAIMSPGARGGLPPVGVSASPGASSGEIDVTVEVTDQLPEGWEISSIAAAAMPEQDPVGIFSGPFVAGSDADPANDITLTGLGSAVDCMAFGWVVYEKPDSKFAYSVSLAQAVTSAA